MAKWAGVAGLVRCRAPAYLPALGAVGAECTDHAALPAKMPETPISVLPVSSAGGS